MENLYIIEKGKKLDLENKKFDFEKGKKLGRGFTLRQKVFTRTDYLIFALLTIVGYSAIGYFTIPWFYAENRSVHPALFWLLTFVIFAKLAIGQLRWWVLPFMKRPVPMRPRTDWRVAVVTTFVPGAESLAMLEETVRAMTAIDYEHDTWVLDEGDDPEVKRLCARLGAFHFSRKNLPRYRQPEGRFAARTKYGNYNSWLYETGFDRYEIIAAFDPDHIPEPHFLTEVLGYFNDPETGYVQAAQVYYNQRASFIARGAAEETYNYYASTQMFCDAMGYPIVTGCHNTHRTTALREVGGFAAHDADDLLITLNYRAAGWNGVYVPKILARGLTPVDWNSYLRQQLRWARSVLDIKFRIHPKMLGRLRPVEIAVSFFHGFYYLQGATILVVLLLLAFMLATGSVPAAARLFFSSSFFAMVVVLVTCEFFRQGFYIDRKNEWGLHWRAAVLQFAKYPYLILALWQVLTNRKFDYSITPKTKTGRRSSSGMLLRPHLPVAGLIAAAWIFGAAAVGDLPPALHLAAAAAVGGTLLLAGTGAFRFPAPFDARLVPVVRKQRRRKREVG